jgi:formylglycine-generating enzyme required for sulfatase activity
MGENPSYFKGDLRPVENIDWHQATTFCQKLTEQARKAGWLAEDFEFRLPTEAEWEYACRAGTTTAFNDGSPCTNPDGKDRALQRLGWHGEGDKGQTHPVGEKQPNAWGLYDMHGNVWESCEDRAEWTGTTVATDTYADGVVDPICEKGARRALRGGGFWIGAWNCRAACRGVNVPGDRIIDAGFRLAAGQPVGRGASRPAS